MANEVEFTLLANLQKATRDLNNFSKTAGSAINGLKSSFNTLAIAAGAVAGAFGVKKLVDAANQQENAVKSLNTALALTGDFTEETSKRFQDFASELQRNSTVGDEVSLSLVGLAKSMGATNDQTEKIIQAAADLSAITGESLETSVRNLSKTLGGLKGELGETQPELRNLTAEQLKAGAAIDILSKKYEGAAKALTGTFAGATKQASNSFGDLLEEIGFLITKNPLVIAAVNKASEVFVRLGNVVKDNREAIIEFTLDSVANITRAFAAIIDSVGFAIGVFQNFETVIATAELIFVDLRIGAIDLADTIISTFKDAVNFGLSPFISSVESVASVLVSLGVISQQQFNEFGDALENLVLDSSTTGLEALRQQAVDYREEVIKLGTEAAMGLEEVTDGFKDASDTVRSYAKEIEELGKKSEKSFNSVSKVAKASATDNGIFSGSVRGGGTGDINSGTPVIPQTFFDPDAFMELLKPENLIPDDRTLARRIGDAFVSFFEDNASTIANAFKGLGSIAGGAAGARDLAKAGLSAGADALLPGAGAAVGPIFDLLMQPSEVVRAQVKAFAEQIPVIIDAIVENLPVFIDALVDNADDIIVALVKGTPQIANAIAIEVPKALILSLKENAPEIWKQIREGFDFELAKIKESFAATFAGPIQTFKQDLQNGFDGLITGLQESVGKLVQGFGSLFETTLTEVLPNLESAVRGLFEGLTFDAVGSFFQNIIDAMVEPFNQLAERIKNALRIDIPGIGDLAEKIGIKTSFGFAKGGEVPAGFPNDTFPARLTSGENVIDRSTNEKLNNFLDNGGGPTQVVLQVGEKQLAEVLLNLNRQGFRIA